MKVGFDLDGTLDKDAIAKVCTALLLGGHEVYIITGIFNEAGAWQSSDAKFKKLARLGIPFVWIRDDNEGLSWTSRGPNTAKLITLHAVDPSFGVEYRLRDLGLRKGALTEELGIELFFDDSELYMEMMPKMNGGVTLLHVR